MAAALVAGCSAPATGAGPSGTPASTTTPVPATTPASRTTTTTVPTPVPTTAPPASTPVGQPTQPTSRAVPPPDPVADPVAGAVVVLDPGHNGANGANPGVVNAPVPDGRGGSKACNTTGTATDAGYPEHAFTFAVAVGVRDRLAARGVRVVLTRPDDGGVGPCVDRRAAIATRAGADAVVSIHGDGAAPGGRGFHVAYSAPPLNGAQSGPAPELARTVRDALVAGGLTPSTYRGEDGLDPRADLAGLNLATQPTVLVECANLRNPDEAAAVSRPEGRDGYARAIADGLLTWLGGR